MSRYDAMAARLRHVEEAVRVVQDPYMRRIAFEHLLLAVGDAEPAPADDRVPRSRVPGYLPDDAPTAVIPAYREGVHRG